MKWLDVSPHNHVRSQTLCQTLNQMGVANELITSESQDLVELIKTTDVKAIRVPLELGATALESLKFQSLLVRAGGAFDSLNFDGHQWWPECLLIEALLTLFKSSLSQVDRDMSVLMVGTDALARVATYALFQAGLKKFMITDSNPQKTKEFSKLMMPKLFGATLQIVPSNELVNLHGESGFVVNALDDSKENPILNDLLYFNFVRQDGVVWDFGLSKTKNIFLEEALSVGLHVTSGIEVASEVDALWVKKIFNQNLDQVAYQTALTAALAKSD